MPKYTPDVSNLRQNQSNFLTHFLNRFISNVRDIARTVNNLDNSNISPNARINHTKIDFTGFDLGKADPGNEIDATGTEYVKIWRVSSDQTVPSDDIYATTGVDVKEDGNVIVDGDLKII